VYRHDHNELCELQFSSQAHPNFLDFLSWVDAVFLSGAVLKGWAKEATCCVCPAESVWFPEALKPSLNAFFTSSLDLAEEFTVICPELESQQKVPVIRQLIFSLLSCESCMQSHSRDYYLSPS